MARVSPGIRHRLAKALDSAFVSKLFHEDEVWSFA